MKLDTSHVCSIYQSEEQRCASLNTFLIRALEQQEKLVVIADPINARANLSSLECAGIDLQHYVAGGQLRILTVHQSFLRYGTFEPSRMIAWLQDETCRAQAEGYRALQIAAEMTWVLLGVANMDSLMDYEGQLNDALYGYECRVLCQYDGRRLFPAARRHVLAVHPTIVVGTTICHNSRFAPPTASFWEGPASTRLDRYPASSKNDTSGLSVHMPPPLEKGRARVRTGP
jgi:hypothetical protein